MLLQARPAPRRSWVRSWLQTLAIPLVVATAFVAVFASFYIPSQSMEPTLQIGDRILVARSSLDPFALQRGDVVVFAVPAGWNVNEGTEHIVKRVIALPGDELRCLPGSTTMYLNDQPLSESYVKDDSCTLAFSITVAPGTVWVEGDNRAESADSRYHRDAPGGGAVPMSDIVGRAYLTVHPFSSAHLLGRS